MVCSLTICFLKVVYLSRRLRLELRLHVDVKQNYIMVRNTGKNINVVGELRAAGDYEIQDTVGLRSGNLMLELSQRIFMKKIQEELKQY